MKLLFVSPGWPKGRLWGELSFKFPSLSLAAIAAVTPPEWQLDFCDDSFEKLDYSCGADIVALTAMTAQINRAYEIADAFRARGTTVVMGGYHVSTMPDEALEHADAVVVGEGELVWPQLLSDWAAGRLKPRYQAGQLMDMVQVPAARREIYTHKKYLLTNTLQTTRGCPHDCEFCSVTAFYGRKYRKRPIELVLSELEQMRARNSFAFFVDDNIVADRRYSLALFQGMKGMGLKWLSHSPIDFARDPELMKAAGESGCLGMFIGFESLDQDRLSAMGKTTNSAQSYLEDARAFRDHGIGILGSFVLGYDGDTPEVFEKTLRFCEQARLESAIFPILTPYPGTSVRRRLEQEGRILSNDWRDYDMEHVTFRPSGMTVEQLQQGYEQLCRDFYSFPSMYRRIFKLHRSVQVFGPMNFGFRGALRRKVPGA
ncbi:B12-binding domain-containing radical SAM protein [Geobacter sp. SVR]|uniref:B12-binding domain-containing radical SAM protein n=1 Tax=Geobacter sp. SVR TaxID=2495594 RepID=UPI00143EFA33|nr:radical SAM protein [Geobacter sp. SVR]BCS54301.1 B12-binding domain-containing radical SAM protein [Geobacter sp. SVR]GCF85840.1 B12-binding domain-containing radical SAM protein [Geobacter sp. SVR]